jgi:putative hydrolase of HD superfamily
MLDFFNAVGGLKRLPRQGWVDRGIVGVESVADHTYRAAMMAWIFGSVAGLNVDRLVRLTLVHDLPEAIVGDATPYAEIIAAGVDVDHAVTHWRELLSPEALAAAKERKHQTEAGGLVLLCQMLPQPAADELQVLWHEYAARSSPEARFVSQIDKLEALLQALEYREAGQPADVESFWQSAQDAVEHPVLRQLLHEIEERMRVVSSLRDIRKQS